MNTMQQTVKGLLDDKMRMLALMSDMHSHLASGKSIDPQNKALFFRDGEEVDELHPSITDILGAMLEEMDAEELFKVADE